MSGGRVPLLSRVVGLVEQPSVGGGGSQYEESIHRVMAQDPHARAAVR